ncbi:hypothetical protein PCH_Pc16g07880 [Penicillium rubens Wisconsin 54-1255]|uniref:Uncharacterized protein n=1 Tax=Penicillium rubens (strain ATCC 28089 / DSM 1075 / NRRL 1951 / Wisconsin 54-1255) TaxID=500485 RepID=B6H7N2_PENRW|nr:hypothetical protein PCH_Pc16g07880 [Penicillium rubens Wisconsin 54-1255]
MENEECQERICIDGQRWFACGCQDASKSQRNSAVPRPRHKDGREWLPGMCTYYLTGEGWVGDSPRIGTQDEGRDLKDIILPYSKWYPASVNIPVGDFPWSTPLPVHGLRALCHRGNDASSWLEYVDQKLLPRASRRAKVKLAIDTKETVQIQRHIAYLIRYDVISTVNDRLPALPSLRMIAHVSFVYMIPTLRGLSDRILSCHIHLGHIRGSLATVTPNRTATFTTVLVPYYMSDGMACPSNPWLVHWTPDRGCFLAAHCSITTDELDVCLPRVPNLGMYRTCHPSIEHCLSRFCPSHKLRVDQAASAIRFHTPYHRLNEAALAISRLQDLREHFRQNCQVLFASALTRLLSHCLPGICGPSGSGCHSLCGYADADLNRPKIPRSGQGIRMSGDITSAVDLPQGYQGSPSRGATI